MLPVMLNRRPLRLAGSPRRNRRVRAALRYVARAYSAGVYASTVEAAIDTFDRVEAEIEADLRAARDTFARVEADMMEAGQ